MRIALVTGGAGGLGLATAKQFVRDGMCVVVADIKLATAASPSMSRARRALSRHSRPSNAR